MMPQIVLYIATIAGALALILALPKRRYAMPKLGAVIGAAALGFAWLMLRTGDAATAYDWPGRDGGRMLYYYLFSLIAIGSAARVITHPRPVYSALWFVLTVLASAGLFLILSAEFMAFAMVIIYGGAILVTYMFVIMLATSSESSERPAAGGASDHDRVAREPIAATAAAFLLLAALLGIAFEPMERNPLAAQASDQAIVAHVLTGRAADVMDPVVREQAAEYGLTYSEGTPVPAEATRLASSERVGLDLFLSHPLGLELAGLILLVALVGAVVIARTRVPDEPGGTSAPADPETGATVHPTHEAGPHETEGIGRIGGRLGT